MPEPVSETTAPPEGGTYTSSATRASRRVVTGSARPPGGTGTSAETKIRPPCAHSVTDEPVIGALPGIRSG